MFKGLVELINHVGQPFLLNPVEIESIRPYAVGREGDAPALVKITCRSGAEHIIESDLVAMKDLFGVWEPAIEAKERQLQAELRRHP